MPASEQASCEIPSIRQPSPTNTKVRWLTIVVGRPVEFLRQELLGESHTDGIREALPKRSGCRLDTGGDADFRMARRLRMELAEVLQLVKRKVVARQMQKPIKKH